MAVATIVNRSNAEFDENGELAYPVPVNTTKIIIQPLGGYVELIPAAESATTFRIHENEKFTHVGRDLANSTLRFRKESQKTVNIEMLRYIGQLS